MKILVIEDEKNWQTPLRKCWNEKVFKWKQSMTAKPEQESAFELYGLEMSQIATVTPQDTMTKDRRHPAGGDSAHPRCI